MQIKAFGTLNVYPCNPMATQANKADNILSLYKWFLYKDTKNTKLSYNIAYYNSNMVMAITFFEGNNSKNVKMMTKVFVIQCFNHMTFIVMGHENSF